MNQSIPLYKHHLINTALAERTTVIPPLLLVGHTMKVKARNSCRVLLEVIGWQPMTPVSIVVKHDKS